jgi:hypothetical protein
LNAARLGQAIVMAAIVDSLLWAPFAALVWLFCFMALGISFQDFLTFGGKVNTFQGIVMMWVLGFVPSLAYSAFAMPWEYARLTDRP